MVEKDIARERKERRAAMSVSAYVFIECTKDMMLNIAKKLSALDDVVSCHAVTGPETKWDLITFVKTSDVDELEKFVAENIKPTEGVIRTSTTIAPE